MCLRDFKTALAKGYYFTVGCEASLAGQLFIFWLEGVYLPIVYLLGHLSLVVKVNQGSLVCMSIVLGYLPCVIEQKGREDPAALIVVLSETHWKSL